MLSSEPTANVTVTIVRSDGTDIRLNKTVLIFTPSNWNVGQTVTLTAAEDEDTTDDSGTLILIASGGGYDGNGVIVSPKTARIVSLGESVQLTATVQDQDGSPVTGVAFDWSSADSSVAVVDSIGKITAVNFGMTTITAALATASGTAEILVKDFDNTPASDRAILEVLFKETGGENWPYRNGWLTDAPLDNWSGVSTDTEGRVTELWLYDSNLTGLIPPELGNLSKLSVLQLFENSLSGPIPPELGNLSQLEDIALSDNSLTGSIPPELGNLPRLENLSLSRNNLTGSIPPELGNLSQLENLDLSENSLVGSIPPELGNLPQLEYLTLSRSNLTGSIPPELGNLSKLRFLWLFLNSLTGPIPPELGNLSRLENLSLANNSLTGSIPPELGNLPQLESLILDRNSLTGSIPPELSNLSKLKILWLFQNSLSGPIPPELGNLSQFVDLTLSSNSLTGSIPPELGNLPQLQYLSLSSNSLTGSIPPELGNLSQLDNLRLASNSLTGLIPPELGNLPQLQDLRLAENFLTGSVPPELGNLSKLRLLGLHDNYDLEGLLPRSFLRLNLEGVNITGTGICGHLDAAFLAWWNNLPDGRAEDCTSEQIERLALMELFDKMNGASWTNASGWGSDIPLGDWHGVTVGNRRVTQLSLPNNALEGSIPGGVANFTELSVLNLADNTLAGTLPKEISLLSELAELRVNDNTGLEGALSYDLTNLGKLEVLHFGGTSLCASPAQTFQTWYTGIGDVSGVLCSNPAEVRLDIPAVSLTQSVQTLQNTVRLVAGRDALLRVFVTGDQLAFFEPEVVATVRGSGSTHRVEMTRVGDRLAVAVDESDLDNSFNAVIPGNLITPDATLVVEADPNGVIPRAAGSLDRFPATGEEPLNVVSVPDMEVTVVPVLEANQPDTSIFAWTDNIGDDSPEVGLFKYAFPFSEFRARSREAYFTSLDLVSDNGQWRLVLELEALRLMDNATGYYYGAAASVNGYVRGRARLGGWTSIGKAWDTELAHEVGHNLDLLHAPCGGALGTDTTFPHLDGSVGTWGVDFRDTTLISPAYHKDIMGYCYDQGWLSDYFFEKVIDYREEIEGTSGLPIMASAARESDVLVLWGGVQGGELRIEPPFPTTAPVLLPETDGPYRLEGLGGDVILFSLSFTPGQDKFGDKYFLFAIPVEQDWEESLEQIVLTGPEGSVTIGADDQRTLSIIRDVRTGQVRGILRDWDGTLPAALEDADNLNITTIQGLPDAVRLQR